MLEITVALVAVLLFIAMASWLSPLLPGVAGEVYRQNVRLDIEATALIYTESGDVRDYLDPMKGKYGQTSPVPDQE
ncbi:MAG: hypothetical protein ABIK09_16965 [Pseudomonadota bacterium]